MQSGEESNAAWFDKAILVVCGAGLGLGVVGSFLGNPSLLVLSGCCLIAGMATALFSRRLIDYRFTLWILIANLAAMLSPNWFKSLGGFSLTDPWLLLIVVQLIMFGMGTQMNVRDFQNVLRMPTGVAIGLLCQFLIMPLLGYSLARAFQFPPEIGAGLVLIGSCSSGLASNVMTFLAKGNLALSVTLTAIATAAAPIVTPLWMRVLAGSMVEVDIVKMFLDIVKMVLVPILAAFIHDFLSSRQRRVRVSVWTLFVIGAIWLMWLACGGWDWIVAQLAAGGLGQLQSWLTLPGFVAGGIVFGCLYHVATRFVPSLVQWMPALSMFGIVYFTLVATAQGRDQLLASGLLLLLAVTLHNLLGIVLGYWVSRIMGLCEQDARTVAIEVGSQNGAMATGLAKGMDKLGTVGLAAIIFAPLMNVTGSLVANHWRNRPVDPPTS